MKRVNFSIKESQLKRLRKHYEDEGVRMSEVVRKAIDLYFKQKDKNGKTRENTKRNRRDNTEMFLISKP